VFSWPRKSLQAKLLDQHPTTLKTPAQAVLAWAIQRGTALLTTTKTPGRIKENFDVSTLPEDAMREIDEGIKRRIRLNSVVQTGVPGFIPTGK